ncbi:Integrase catalytic region, partial [mine drainage metagenome]
MLGNSSQAYPNQIRRKSGQGKHHPALALRTGVVFYFADPRSPWQRGSNENTDCLL